MKLLALDTSTEACSAALWLDGEVLERYQIAPREHSQLILSMCDELLGQAQLSLSQMDAVAFGRGPGSFVGVRIATGVAQGIAYASDLPVVPISSLAAMAYGSGHSHVVAAIDARMQEVYWAHFYNNGRTLQLLAGEGVCPAAQVPAVDEQQTWFGVGSGWCSYYEELNHIKVESWAEAYPGAAAIAALGAEELNNGSKVMAQDAIPVYLRDQVAKRPKP